MAARGRPFQVRGRGTAGRAVALATQAVLNKLWERIMARPKDLAASSAEEEASAQAAPEASAKAHERTKAGGIQPPDPAKQSAYPLRDNAGWPTGRGPDNRFRAEQTERDRDPDREPDKDPESPATQRPIQDRTGVVAPPTAGEQPGASGALEGTPSAPAAGRGRQID